MRFSKVRSTNVIKTGYKVESQHKDSITTYAKLPLREAHNADAHSAAGFSSALLAALGWAHKLGRLEAPKAVSSHHTRSTSVVWWWGLLRVYRTQDHHRTRPIHQGALHLLNWPDSSSRQSRPRAQTSVGEHLVPRGLPLQSG